MTAALCALAVLPATPAAAEDGAEVGGTVDGVLRLELDAGADAPLAFAAGVAQHTLRATVVATDGPVALSVADGDRADGGRLGRLESSRGALGSPLEIAGPGQAFAPLGAEPLLRLWNREIGATTTEIRFRQRATAREMRAAPYEKTVLVTATVGGP